MNVQIRVLIRYLTKKKEKKKKENKWFNSFYTIKEEGVGGLATDCAVLGGRKGNSDEGGRFLTAARTDGTQRWGHMGLFWKKTESPNLNGDSKTPNQTCRANKGKHRLKRTAVNELRRQPLMLGGTLEQPFSNQSSYLLAKTRAAISFIRDVDFQSAMAVLSLLLLFLQITLPQNSTTVPSSQPYSLPSASSTSGGIILLRGRTFSKA